MKKPELIVIDGTDGSGKHTQAENLKSELEKLGLKVKLLSFPRYEDDITIPVKRYLEGEYGKDAEDINPYAAASFYAIDRFDYFKKNDLKDYDVIICDRYTTSNIIHQGSKLSKKEERDKYIDWLEDFEYEKIGIPKPDLIFFLKMPYQVTEDLINQRSEKENRKKDIHEKNSEYLKKTLETAEEIADERGWKKISCYDNSLKEINDITQEILIETKDYLEKNGIL